MTSSKLCVCDRTRENLIGTRLDLVNTVSMRFAELVRTLSNVPESGLWLNHFRGIPRGSGLSRFDVIFLDEEGCVLDCVEGFTEAEFEPLKNETESALILHAHTLASLQVRPGDQLRICQSNNIVVGGSASSDRQCIRDVVKKIKPQEPASNPISNANEMRESKPKLSLKEQFLRWLSPEPEVVDRRSGTRLVAKDLIAYYWTGGSPMSYKVRNVSNSGLYLFSEERWPRGTRLLMTLQKRGADPRASDEITRVESEVIRWGEDGFGCRFIESGFVDLNSGEIVQGGVFDRAAFDRFLKRATNPSQA